MNVDPVSFLLFFCLFVSFKPMITFWKLQSGQLDDKS